MSLTKMLPDIRLLSPPDKLRLILLLAMDIDTVDAVEPLEHGRAYRLASPTFEVGAAEALLKELNSCVKD